MDGGRHPRGTGRIAVEVQSLQPSPDDDKLYVESNANFPHRGYLLVADDEGQGDS